MSKLTTPLADTGKTVETLSGAAGRVLQGAQQLAELNLQATRTTLAELAENVQAAVSAKSPAEFVKLQTAALQAAPQKALAYGRHVKEIIAAMAVGQREAAEAQMAEVQAKFLETVEGALRNAPGSQNIVTLVKSAVATVNNAYDGVNKASKQVSTALETNVTRVAETVSTPSRGSLATIDA
jgi:phasin family protein